MKPSLKASFYFCLMGLSSCAPWLDFKTDRGPASVQLVDGAENPKNSTSFNPYLNREIKALSNNRLAPATSQEDKSDVNSTYQFLLGSLFSNEGRNEEAARAFEQTQKYDPDSSQVHLALSQEYLKKGWVTEGIALLRKAIEIDPKNHEAKSLLANMLSSARKYGEAYVILEEVIKEDPDDEESRLLLVLLDIELKNPAKAEKRLKDMVKDNPDSALAYFYLGRLAQEKNQNKEAMAYYKKAIDLRSGFVQAGTYLGALQENSGDKDGALDTYTWLAGQTDSASFHKKLGQLQLEKNQYDKALQSFENFERLEPGDLSNKIRLGLLYMQLKKPDMALGMFREALKKNPEADALRVYVANVLEQLGKVEEAVAEYARVTDKDPKIFSEALKRRLFLTAKSNPAEAEKLWQNFYSNAHDSRKLSEEVFTAGILMYDAMNKYDEALQLHKQSEAHLPHNQALLYLKGMILEKKGEWKKAVEVMHSLLALNSKHASAMNFIGYIWADHGIELKKAEKLIRKALKLKEGDALIKDSLGWVLFKKKKYEEARTYLEEAHKLEPKESIIAEHLADTLVKLNSFEEAQKFYELAVKLDPDTQEVKDLIQEKLAALRRGQPLDPCEPKSFNEKNSGSECNTARIRNQNLRTPSSEK